MICVSIHQESRRLALADMVNAAAQADLLEIRLDRFVKAPDVGELLKNKPKPVIMSCRRPRDGGHWRGSEEERLALLRQCIVSRADYVEIELDVADQIRKFPPTRRVISYTNLSGTPRNIAEVHAAAQKKAADVVKLTTLARTPAEAWPVVQTLARSSVPTVAVGLGKPGLTLALLGKKLAAPWTYATVEPGRPSYPGQPTVHELRDIYHYNAIGRTTRFVAVVGFCDQAQATAAVLNAVLESLELPARCLPMAVGKPATLAKLASLLKLGGMVAADNQRADLASLAAELEPAGRAAQAADVALPKNGQWRGYSTVGRAAIAALEQALPATTTGSDRSLNGRLVMIAGACPAARAVAHQVKQRGGMPIIASRDANDAQFAAQLFGCRQMKFEGIYSAMHDVLIVCSEEREKLPARARSGETGVHAGYLKPNMTVMDLTSLPRESVLLQEARLRGCHVVPARQAFLNQLQLQTRLITGRQPPRELLEETLEKVTAATD